MRTARKREDEDSDEKPDFLGSAFVTFATKQVHARKVWKLLKEFLLTANIFGFKNGSASFLKAIQLISDCLLALW